MGDRALPGGDGRHLRDLLRHAVRPRAARGRQRGHAGRRRTRRQTSSISTSRSSSSTRSSSSSSRWSTRSAESFVNREDVNDVVLRAAPVTASLVFGGAIVWLLRAPDRHPQRAQAALAARPGRDGVRADRPLRPPGLDRPDLRLRLRLQAGADADRRLLRLLQPVGERRCGGPVQWAYHMILPWATFTILFAALYVRLIRANVMETMNEDYVRTARAKGAPEGRVMRAPRAPEQHAAGRDDPRHGHRARARRRDLHRDRSSTCPGSASRSWSPTTTSTCR